MIEQVTRPERVAPLLEGWQETMLWSCLQEVMGTLYAPEGAPPRSVLAALGDFRFFAGAPDRELALFRPEGSGNFAILVPRTPEWEAVIEDCWGERAHRTVRYAIRKEPGVFDRARLEALAGTLPPGVELHPVDEALFFRCREEDWSRDLTSQFPSYDLYRERGLGVAALRRGELLSGASSYSAWQGGIEVEIDTRPDCRRQGLAAACGAALILRCLDRGLYPSWDAQNLWSVALAEKLGYHPDRAYPVYELHV